MRLPAPSRALRFILWAGLVLGLALPLALPRAAQAWHKAPDKRGILLVAFGTSVPEAAVAIDAIRQQAEAAFPGLPVRLAYSSKIIRDKLSGEGAAIKSPAQALADMAAEGFTKVAVQSLHAIPGREYSDIKATSQAFQAMPKGIRKVSVGRPLLYSHADIAKASEAILLSLPKHKKGEAVLLMGHGTDHPANAAYAALQLALWKHDQSVFIATVEGTPGLDEVIPELKRLGVRSAHLVPLMSVAGDHAKNDMVGKDVDSWASKLKTAGIKSTPVLVGLGSRPAVAGLWVDHLRDAVQELGD